MTTYVLAHLSDPHLGPLPRPRLVELAGKRAIGYLNWWRKRGRIHQGDILRRIVADLKAQVYDHIAVTGDLVNISLPGEYAPALAWLESLGPPQDVTLVPGNHDAYVWAAARFPQSQWGRYLSGDDAGGAAAANGPVFPFLRRRGPLALIGLSSAVPTAPLMASGELGRDQIARCAELLDRCRGEDVFRVVLIHHPPVSKRKHHLRRLVDSARVLRDARPARRRARPARARPYASGELPRRAAAPRARGGRAVGLRGAAGRARRGGLQSLPDRALCRRIGAAR